MNGRGNRKAAVGDRLGVGITTALVIRYLDSKFLFLIRTFFRQGEELRAIIQKSGLS
jgi:hypothetical protein